MTTIVSSKGQIVLPVEIRRQDDVRAGQRYEIERIDRGEYRLRRQGRRRNAGLINLLLDCPAKGWFRPMDRSRTTDAIDAPELG